MLKLFGRTKVQENLKPFNPDEGNTGQIYQFILQEMRTWGRPASKMVLMVQLCSLDIRVSKRTEEGDVPRRLRLYLESLNEDQFQAYLDGIYGEEVCGGLGSKTPSRG